MSLPLPHHLRLGHCRDCVLHLASAALGCSHLTGAGLIKRTKVNKGRRNKDGWVKLLVKRHIKRTVVFPEDIWIYMYCMYSIWTYCTNTDTLFLCWAETHMGWQMNNDSSSCYLLLVLCCMSSSFYTLGVSKLQEKDYASISNSKILRY